MVQPIAEYCELQEHSDNLYARDLSVLLLIMLADLQRIAPAAAAVLNQAAESADPAVQRLVSQLLGKLKKER